MKRFLFGLFIIALPIVIGLIFFNQLHTWPKWTGIILIYSIFPCSVIGWGLVITSDLRK